MNTPREKARFFAIFKRDRYVLFLGLPCLLFFLAGFERYSGSAIDSESMGGPSARARLVSFFLPPETSRTTSTQRGGKFSAPTPTWYWMKDIMEMPYVRGKEVTAKVTAYEPSSRSCGRFADGKTSIMKNAWKMDGVAIYPQAIPYHTILFIPGVGFKVADDTGSAMKKSWLEKQQVHIDLRMPTYEGALQWGVHRDVPVTLFYTKGN